MKKKFTFLTAAFMLLAFLAIPLGMRGQTTYEQLTSIASIDESAQYVLGIDGTGFHYSGTSSWGLTALPSAQTPIYYTLTKANDGNSFTAQATISGTNYYLQVPTSNTFSMATTAGTNTDLIIGTTQVSGTNYAVANKSNTNRHLRNNGSSGLRSYAGTTGTMAYFYKVVPPSGDTYTVTYHPNGPTADDVEDEYNEGDDVTVRPANTFTYTGHAFTEWNTEEDGTGDSYDPEDVIEGIDEDIDLYARWEESDETVDELTATWTGVTANTYTDWSDISGASGAVYAGKTSNNNNGIGLRTSNSNEGIITTTSGGFVRKVAVTWQSTTANRSVQVYGKNTAYTAASDLFDNTNQGDLLGTISYGDSSTEITVDGDYAYVGIRSASSALVVSLIQITWEAVSSEVVATPAISPNGGEFLNSQEVSITCATDDATIYYTTDGTDPTDESEVYSAPFTITANTTVKAFAVKADMDDSEIATAVFTKVTPMTVAEALAASEQEGVFVSGIISEITEVSTSYHNATYKISDDGTQSGEMTVFRGRYLNNTDFTSEDQIQVGDVVVVYGNLSAYQEVNQLAQGNYLVSLVRPVKAATPTFSPAAGTYYAAQSVTIACETDGATIYYTTNGSNPTTESSVYSEAISVSASTTIKAFAVMDGMIDSDIATAEYTIILNPSITVDPDELDLNAEEHNGTLSLTYANLTITAANNFAIQYYDAEDNELNGDDEPDWIEVLVAEQDPNIGEGYVVSYYMVENEGDARTAYFKVFAMDGEEFVYSNLVTVTQAEFVVDYAELPFAFDGGKADIASTTGLTQDNLGTDYTNSPKLRFEKGNKDNDGLYSTLILKINERPGTLTFDIKGNGFSGTFKVQTSADGETYTDLETYTELSSTGQSEEFTNLGESVRYIKWIYSEKVNGNVALGNIELAEYSVVASITVDPDELDLNAEEHNGTLDLTYENLTITAADNFAIQYYDAEDNELNGDDEPDWIDVTVAEQDPQVGEGYVVSYYMLENEGGARTAYFKVFAEGSEDFVYSNLVTISQAAPVVPPTPGNWVLTAFEDLTPADVFVIVGTRTDATYGGDYAMSNDNGTSAPSTVAVTVDNGALSGEIASNIQWNLTVSSGGYTFYPAGHSDSYLYCTNTNNGVKVGTGDAKHFNLSDDGYLTTTETSGQRYIGIYNAQDWRCYTSSGGNIANQTFTFYKKVSADVTCIKENIVAYTPGTNDRYYLIASPVASVTPSSENGFLNGTVGAGNNTYDLYYFDESQDQAEWRNYEATSFNLVSGKGYLYANGTGTDLTFTGQPYNGNGLVELAYTPGNQVAGWNLIGNPYATNATLSQPYYRLNDDGSALKTETESTAVAAMEGVFVHATEAGQTAVFTASRGGSQAIAKANLQVVGNNGTVIDNAIVRFDNGQTLEKFIFGNPAANIYFAQDGKEYAIVRSEAQGEMPVNFKAAENGTYTISVEAENLSVEYLHLIDNMTGANVDLLATPSYTFEARKNDYASRFRLVFNANAGNSEVDDDFAFVSDGNIVISNEGEATLQVIDMLGRVISTQIVNGSASIENIGVSGVYVLRLVNGNNVKTQRIVVR